MRATIQYIRRELKPFYPIREIEGFINLIFSHLKNYSLTDLVLKEDEKLSEDETEAIEKIVSRLKLKEPVQYIIGKTEFCGLNLYVNRDVLIPRPETEELAEWIRHMDNFEGPVLDIGTGSGCIALAIKSFFPETQVKGVDISSSALQIAEQNRRENNLDVGFFMADILQWEKTLWDHKFGLVVSNPPYVTLSEKEVMDDNVLKFEPHRALFVADDNPLKYYFAILDFCEKWLKPNGWVYFEINEQFGSQIVDTMQAKGFQVIEIKKDMQGKERMVRGRK